MTNKLKIISAEKPVNIIKSQSLFDNLTYVAYEPAAYYISTKIVITRMGQCFSKIGYIRNSMYENSYVFIRSLMISLMSILKRGIINFNNGKKNYAIIHTPWSAGYYHWMTESIPRLMACVATGEKFCLLLPDKKNYEQYEESIRMLGVNEVDYFPEGKNVWISNVLMTDVPREFGTTDPKILWNIREFYSRAVCGAIKMHHKRRVYITRAQSRGRRVINEAAVIALLYKYGFEVQAFENFSFTCQVRLMNETEVLISIHGAALTNMIFMPSGGKVLELVPKKRPILDYNIVRNSFRHDPCYIRLASAMGHRYYVQTCTPINLRDRTTHMADIIVDIDMLRKNIEEMFTCD